MRRLAFAGLAVVALTAAGCGGGDRAGDAPEPRPAGLYRATEQVDGQPAVGGWIVLSDGRQQGAVRTSTGFIDQEGNFARPEKPVTSFTSNETDI